MLAVRVSESNLVSTESNLVSNEFTLATKPAKPAARAGANHAGATAVPSACQALSSVRHEEHTSTSMFSHNSSFVNSSFSDFSLRSA
jgi:hypothetical protein